MGFVAIETGVDNSVALRGCPFDIPGDLNDDCKITIIDFAIMAETWVSDFADLKDISNNWLINCITNPFDPACVPK